MPKIYLSDFVDVVSKAGSPKATKVRSMKNRAPYSPATDFYKPLRDGLVELHREGWAKSALSTATHTQDGKKVEIYKALTDGYRKWWGKKTLEWFTPPSEIYTAHGVEVVVNPNLGLEVNGVPHVIKLHLKAEQLSKTRADLICGLMNTALGTKVPDGAVIAVLDVRNSKLFAAGSGPDALTAMIDAELAYIADLWPKV
ncbi:MAG: hypothetical protein BGP24_11130 [Lysobacterales bacterium 69-70]|nr:hypothetical protein [Xanthomonadaceae bacterium]ODU30781.1 MAG: hypothetical protein ABS97_20900 [Xanthomonadaceae bacterium SCN 69-320]ODV22108.1 MAG: hypothetical protein ABT27_02275 [Xanthomonadaceae bacterium SCN 69-25]OJY98369.1 MAG: hypothetical protein BGP24_11130 [Xanthomonadales bacterium 69-70]